MGLVYTFRDSVYYHYDRKHGSVQEQTVLEKELRVLHLDPKTDWTHCIFPTGQNCWRQCVRWQIRERTQQMSEWMGIVSKISALDHLDLGSAAQEQEHILSLWLAWPFVFYSLPTSFHRLPCHWSNSSPFIHPKHSTFLMHLFPSTLFNCVYFYCWTSGNITKHCFVIASESLFSPSAVPRQALPRHVDNIKNS